MAASQATPEDTPRSPTDPPPGGDEDRILVGPQRGSAKTAAVGTVVRMTDLYLDPGQYDLRAFIHAVGHFDGSKALTSTPPDRPEPDVPAELLDADNAKVDSDPLAVAAFVDGIQSSIILTHRAHRPVYLNYVAAGGVGTTPTGRPNPIGDRQHLSIVCSFLDRDWIDEVFNKMRARLGPELLDGYRDLPVDELPVELPDDVQRSAMQVLGNTRDQLERRLVEDLLDQGHTPLALDGALVGRPFRSDLVGIVKTTGRKYMADESYLYRLPQGWRSPRFKIPAGTAGSVIDRYSCYVRMFDASEQAWNFGLIRVESFDPDLLDPLAARCLGERQNASTGDKRWDRHLASVRGVEEFLRSRRPSLFTLRG